ncbi:MAG: CBASS oligonucleotide cyclase [Polyangia bacterium]
MKLMDQQLEYYVQEVLAFRREDKRKYQEQIDYLKTCLDTAIRANSNLAVLKFLQAGSWRKGTALRPRDGHAIDIDLAVFLNVSEAKREDIATLHELIIDLLCKTYPTKPKGDFTPSRKTVGIEFRTSGLQVDLVPVIPIQEPAGYVWQPEVGGGGAFLTSIEGQLEFIRRIKDQDPRFTKIVRLAKRWRNYGELKDLLSSFALELIVAFLVVDQGAAPTIEEGLIRLLLFIAQSGLSTLISFPEAIRNIPASDAPVRILDPTNNENNVTVRMTDDERKQIVDHATATLETLNYAQDVGRKGETIGLWKEVFGPSFSVEEE